MSSGSGQRSFQLKLNPLTGNSEWVVIDEDDQVSEFSQQPILATTSYLDMLKDSCRNRAFREAIDKTIAEPCHVLDIGAGTGLLSMMAARAMERAESAASSSAKGVVTACESYLPMVKLMRKVLRVNGMGKNINLFNKRSDELKVGVDIPTRADVLVSEILDCELLGEGLIPSLQHAHDNLLVENPKTVPYRATTYGQLVESTFLWKLHDISNNEANVLDHIHLVPPGLDTILRVKSQQHAMHCDPMTDQMKLLSEPFKIFEFDFWKRPSSYGETQLHIKATNDGRVHAIISWWILQLDCEGTIFYSTAPRWISLPFSTGSRNWCDHWKQCVWFIPREGIPVSKGEEVQLRAVHSDISISYDLKSKGSGIEVGKYNNNAGDFHLMLSPERIAIYGDNDWRRSMLAAVRNGLRGRAPSLCVVADDSVFLTLLVANLSKTSHVISLFPGLRKEGAHYLQAVADANGFLTDRVEVPAKRKANLNIDDTHGMKVDLLIGEPFYYGTDGMLPWQNLRFWKERTMLDSVLSKDALIMPYKGILKGCAMSLPDLWNSRRRLGKIEGFDHSVVNSTLGACDAPAVQEGPCLPYFIWQCGGMKELSQTFTIMEFDFSKPINPCHGKTKVEFTEHGVCHGFALWIDWTMDVESSIVLSTGLGQRYWKQGVKLVGEPVTVGTPEQRNVGACHSALIQASFDPSSGDLIIKHAFS